LGKPLMLQKSVPLDDFSTGVSERASIFADMINPLSPEYGVKAALASKNVKMDKDGIESCKGYREVLTSALADMITGEYEYILKGLTTQRFHLVTAGTDLYVVSGASATSIYSGLTPDIPCNFITYNGVVIVMNGIDDMIEWAGSGSAVPVTVNDPNTIFDNGHPAFAEIFRNQLFYSGDPVDPYKIWKPAPGTHNDFDNTLGTVDGFLVGAGDGQAITGLKALTNDIMLIYKENKVLGLSGSSPFGSEGDPFTIREVSSNIGCIAPKSIVSVGKDHFFLSSEGFKSFSTVQQYGDIQDGDPMYKLSRYWETINRTESALSKAFATYIPSEKTIYLHLPSGASTQNDVIFTYHVLTGTTGIRTGITAACGAMVNGKYYTGGYTGQVSEQLFGHTYGESGAIETSWESKWLFYSSSKKIFRNLQLYFDSNGTAVLQIQVQVMKMNGEIVTVTKTASGVETTDVFDVALFDISAFDAGGASVFKMNNVSRGRAVKVKIINNAANQNWRLQKFEIGVVNLGRAAA